MADKDFIFGVFTEPDHRGGLQRELPDATFALDGDPSAGCTISQHTLGPWLHGQLLRAEELLAIDRTLHDPLIRVTGP